MNKNDLSDKIFDQLYKQSKTNGFFSIYSWVEKKLGIDNEKLVNKIIENMSELNWIERAQYSEYDVSLTYTGIKDFEKYGSYSSYEKLIKSVSKKDQRKKKFEKYITIVLTLLFGFSTLILGWLKYYNDKTVEQHRTKIDE